MTGKRFGRLIVLERSDMGIHGGWTWACLCDCGNHKIVSGHKLRRDNTKSCGCLREPHGEGGTPFRRKWDAMIGRCKRDPHYISRSITVNPRWHSYEFFKEDMYESYIAHVERYGTKQTTLDRKDNNGPYCKGNCRWATLSEQRCNRDQQVKTGRKTK